MPLTGFKIRFVPILLFLMLLFVGEPAQAEEVPFLSPDALVCSRCHATAPTAESHLKFPGGQEDCLQCHNPHSRAGPPFFNTPPKERCTACHFEYGAKALGDVQKSGQVIHLPALEQKCAECHLPHELGAPSRYLNGDQNGSCANCHDLTRQKQSNDQHGPFRDNFCTDCHDPHASREPQLLRAATSQLCGSCHKSTQEQSGLPVQHNPFGAGRCTDCHSAHAGKGSQYLKVAAGELCMTCHFPDQKPFAHAPYRDGTCTDCHNPHASRTRRLLVAESNQALCAKCHSAEVAKFDLPSRHPVGEQLDCSSCHRPHTADFNKLLPADGAGLCVTCHASQGRHYSKIGHSRMTVSGSTDAGVCANCHLPHGSANVPLLKGENGVSLCRACHGVKSEFEHPMGENTVAPHTGKPVVCGTCHDPHGSPYSSSTRKKGDGLCLTCHDR